MAEASTKRKRPPTFHHFPINRAKILKKTWVETAKVKSKWKAEKRKTGLMGVGGPPNAEGPLGDEESEEEKEEESGSDVEEEEAPTPSPDRPKKSIIHPSRAHIHEPEPKPKPAKRIKRDDSESVTTPAPSLRDLTREAYSRSTLHTYKSDPLNRRRGLGSRGRGRGGDRDGSRGRGRGRGQPNMKLRMDVMLEKIKRDLT